MTIDPRDKNSWYGFLDLLRPPTGHRLVAAFGTAFGLSFDALMEKSWRATLSRVSSPSPGCGEVFGC
jgi:hypothetical protein